MNYSRWYIMPFNKNLKPEDVDYDNSGANFIESFVTQENPKGRWMLGAIHIYKVLILDRWMTYGIN